MSKLAIESHIFTRELLSLLICAIKAPEAGDYRYQVVDECERAIRSVLRIAKSTSAYPEEMPEIVEYDAVVKMDFIIMDLDDIAEFYESVVEAFGSPESSDYSLEYILGLAEREREKW